MGAVLAVFAAVQAGGPCAYLHEEPRPEARTAGLGKALVRLDR